jgi:hypothetical protein
MRATDEDLGISWGISTLSELKLLGKLQPMYTPCQWIWMWKSARHKATDATSFHYTDANSAFLIPRLDTLTEWISIGSQHESCY